MSALTLHSTLGVTPRVTTCRTCGKSVGVALLGLRDSIRRCRACDRVLIGMAGSEPCPACGEKGPHLFERKISEHEELPIEECNECRTAREAEAAKHAAAVAAGGVYFRCKCGATGVVKSSAPLAGLVRERAGVAAPAPVGVELDECPQCQEEAMP